MIRRRRRWRIPAAIVTSFAVIVLVVAAFAGFFDREPWHMIPAIGRRSPVGAVYFSGDMGLRFGMGRATTAALGQHGIAVIGVGSSTLFATHQSRADVDRIVADAVRQGLERTGAHRLVLIGQSFGADIVQTGLANLPADLRGKVAAVILVVPGRTVFFRADPSGLAYEGTPDSIARDTARTIDWAPLTCIYGRAETDSLCPELAGGVQHIVGMPGGHVLNRDDAALTTQVLAAIARAVPGAIGTTQPRRIS